jgi:hypothetical protein
MSNHDEILSPWFRVDGSLYRIRSTDVRTSSIHSAPGSVDLIHVSPFAGRPFRCWTLDLYHEAAGNWRQRLLRSCTTEKRVFLEATHGLDAAVRRLLGDPLVEVADKGSITVKPNPPVAVFNVGPRNDARDSDQ